MVDIDAAFGEQFLDVAVRQAIAQYQRTATTITSAGKRNPAKAERGGDQRRDRAADFTGQPCLIIRSANATEPVIATEVASDHRDMVRRRSSAEVGRVLSELLGIW